MLDGEISERIAPTYCRNHTREDGAPVTSLLEAGIAKQMVHQNVVDYEIVPGVRDTAHVLEQVEYMPDRNEVERKVVLTLVLLWRCEREVQVSLGVRQREQIPRALVRR